MSISGHGIRQSQSKFNRQNIERLVGVMGAVENRYQRSQIQTAAHRYEQQIYNGVRPIIALNKYRNDSEEMPEFELART
ncbi:MAG: methylmalonyl-CoA mutase family protein, partial [Chthoniobacterales bacterium]